jgi:hypothetical protein
MEREMAGPVCNSLRSPDSFHVEYSLSASMGLAGLFPIMQRRQPLRTQRPLNLEHRVFKLPVRLEVILDNRALLPVLTGRIRAYSQAKLPI